MPMDRGTPDLVRHCVAAVAKQYGGDTSKAFAICVAQLQKNGYLKPGTMELTAAGKAKEKEHEAEPDAAKKLKAYEKLLKANRKEESTADFDRLMNPSERSGFEDLPRSVSRRYEAVSKQESSMDTMRRLAGLDPRHTDRVSTPSRKRLAEAAPPDLLLKIAKKHFDRSTLATKSSGEDFFEVASWTLKAALEEAYEAGFKAGADQGASAGMKSVFSKMKMR